MGDHEVVDSGFYMLALSRLKRAAGGYSSGSVSPNPLTLDPKPCIRGCSLLWLLFPLPRQKMLPP